jgi:hypothetical protein
MVVQTHNTTPATFVRLAVSGAVANWGLGVSAGVKRSGYSTASGAIDARDVHAVGHVPGPRLPARRQLGLAIHGRR